MSSDSWLQFLHELQSTEGRKFFSLEDCRRLLASLGDPQNVVPSVHIVGTNGKGSVGAMLASIVQAAGRRVGHTSSPHLYEFNERCCIDGVPIDMERYAATCKEVYQAAQKIGFEPTFFVLTLVASFLEFARSGLDWMIIEAGLGGEFDGSNVLGDSRAQVMTSVGYDHMEILGSTLPQIAATKARIAKPGVPFFLGEVSSAVEATVRRVVSAVGVEPECFGRDFILQESCLRIETKSRGQQSLNPVLLELPMDALGLKGEFQKRNAALAARVAVALGFSQSEIASGLENVRWPGRYEEFILDGQKVIFDVAHNEQGMESLAGELQRNFAQGTRLIFVLSMLDRKDYRGSLAKLLNLREKFGNEELNWICTRSHNAHSRDPKELADFLISQGQKNVRVSPHHAQAFALANEQASPTSNPHLEQAQSLLVVTGSLYLVADLRPRTGESLIGRDEKK